MSFHYQVPKRFSDLNVGGHVDHAVLIDYLQEARTELLLSAPEPMPAMLDSGVLVTGHQVEYLAPIGYRAPVVDAEVWVDQVGAARFSISYRLSDDGVPVARARTFCVPYDLTTATMRRLAADERALLTGAIETPVPITPLPKVRVDLGSAAELPIRVRWADLDSYRHVNNVKFYDYVAQGRMELLSGARLGGGVDPWVVRQQDLDYRLPIDFRREPYRVRTAVTALGDTSCTLSADIVDPSDQRCFATARSVVVLLGADGRPQPIPGEWRDKLVTVGSPA
ncbi:acyl-CoA thioesterase [Microlunatus soli]|uniref:Acyl-CoA thioester hydrolase n=1 Tax=Microlunatus soli TaxID=630515 RepID=A0A1H1Y2W0_9ACTN|nr:thioesterase family protein [Microlunatus soli]SDT15848.1 acyl-CoA thioester hydrolase [Microlunatus soli]